MPGSSVVVRSFAELAVVVEGASAVEVDLRPGVVLPFISQSCLVSASQCHLLYGGVQNCKNTPARALHDCIFNASAIILGLANRVGMSPVRRGNPVTGDAPGG